MLIVPGVQVCHVVLRPGHIYLQIVERNVGSSKFLRAIFFCVGLSFQARLVEGGEMIIHRTSVSYMVFPYAVFREVTHRELFTVYQWDVNVFILLVVTDDVTILIVCFLLFTKQFYNINC